MPIKKDAVIEFMTALGRNRQPALIIYDEIPNHGEDQNVTAMAMARNSMDINPNIDLIHMISKQIIQGDDAVFTRYVKLLHEIEGGYVEQPTFSQRIN